MIKVTNVLGQHVSFSISAESKPCSENKYLRLWGKENLLICIQTMPAQVTGNIWIIMTEIFSLSY